MTRTENDLRDALLELAERADQHGAPTAASIINATAATPSTGRRQPASHRVPRWLPPLAAAAVVAAVAIAAVTIGGQHNAPSHRSARQQAAGRHSGVRKATGAATTAATHAPAARDSEPPAATILGDAAERLSTGSWAEPAPQDFFYVHTTDATTWTSVSGTRPGDGRAANGTRIWVAGCAHGRIVSAGESGSCTLNDVPHYLRNAPTRPAAWNGYLERMAPGSRAGGAQGKIIVQVLHQDLVAPKAAAALLRYTANCPGLHTLRVRPVTGEKLIGVTCTSMTNGSYALAFDARSHRLVGFVGVAADGRQQGPAEIVRRTGIVASIGRVP